MMICYVRIRVIVFLLTFIILKDGGWWRWALVSPDGVAPSRIVSVSASVNLPLHHKVQKFSSGLYGARED